MPRPLRIEFPGACYHVMSRGNGRQWLYKSAHDLSLFTDLLRECIDKFHVILHAAVLMRNHYHFLLETPQPNLSMFIQKFNSEFARRLNQRVSRQGSVFRHHYKAILVEKNQYYQAVFRYICQNPIRAGLTKKAEKYPASSIAWWFSDPKIRNLISWRELYLPFLLPDRDIRPLIRWINDETEPDPYPQEHPALFGSAKWMKKIASTHRISDKLTDKIGMKSYRAILFSEKNLKHALSLIPRSLKRPAELYIRFRFSGISIRDLTASLGLKSVASASQTLHRFRIRLKTDTELSRIVADIEKRMQE